MRGASGGERRPDDPDRGVSELVGIILLFGLVITGSTLILVSSSALQEELRNQGRIETASATMKEIASSLESLAYRSNANVSNVDFPTEAGGKVTMLQDHASIRINLHSKDRAACQANLTLDAMKYSQTDIDRSVVFEGGGVWQLSENRAQMVSPPSLSYRNGSVAITAIELNGDVDATTSGISATRNTQLSTEKTTAAERDLVTPESDCEPRRNVTITVESSFQTAWAGYLREEFPAGTLINDQNDTDGKLIVHLNDTHLEPFDSDDDGVPDGSDNCKTYNPGQANTDDVGGGDVCDIDDDGDDLNDLRSTRDGRTSGHYGFVTDDYFQDHDGDTFLDFRGFQNKMGNERDKDNCPKRENDAQFDLDGDAIGFVCDSDPDGDGLFAGDDNCIKSYNPIQNNSDPDDRGDVCDADDDNDGVKDPWTVSNLGNADNCPRTPNSDQDNFDGNVTKYPTGGGIRGDACDEDMDNDGILNDDEWGQGDPSRPDECLRDSNSNTHDDDNNGITGDANEVPEFCEDYNTIGNSNTDRRIWHKPNRCDKDDTETWYSYDSDPSETLPSDALNVDDDDRNARYGGGSDGIAPQGCLPSEPPIFSSKNPAKPRTDVVLITVVTIDVEETE